MPSERVLHWFGVLFLLAALNDAIDLLNMFSPLVEFLLDAMIAILLLLSLRILNPLLFLIAVLDVLPRIDFAPFWTLYVIYLYVSKMEEKYRKGEGRKPVRKIRVKVE
ncbi:MAG: hypothetical protein DRJ51_01805 [Thermoprotei archaeon]|nr:MAG: hypothetical protein DRJ51_01805 [Thermoprotei archaeon]RLF02958.1 MAG: hypothetical protein DRJ59_02145 [Thermoprotei archaeon]